MRSDRRTFLAGSLALGASGALVGMPAAAASLPPARTPLSRLAGTQVPTPLCFAPAGLGPVTGAGPVAIGGRGRLSPAALEARADTAGDYVFELAENGIPGAGRGCDATHGQMHAAGWAGVSLAALLGSVPADAAVLVEGADGAIRLPAAKAMRDAFLATRMNGEAVGPWHGGPVRLVLPGWDGALWMRGVRRVTLVRAGVDVAGPGAGPRATDDLHPSRAAFAPHVLGVKSVITAPGIGRRLTGAVAGLAWTGSGRVTRVDVTPDGGATWLPARVEPPANEGALQRFSLTLPAGRWTRLGSRAQDSAGGVQPPLDSPLLAGARATGRHLNPIAFWPIGPDGNILPDTQSREV